MELYWILEYGKVFFAYMFLMFLWPTIVFWRYLKGRSKLYRFNFCITVQVVLINITVLMLGLFHILDRILIMCLFYSVFLISIYRLLKNAQWKGLLFRGKSIQIFLQNCKDKIKVVYQALRRNFGSRVWEYILLFIIVVFGMIYFSYGAFQVQCYGAFDMLTHHRWVNSLVEGEIFPDGIYPEAMHCFIYCLNALFGIRIYSIMKFLQCIHIMVFFLSIYGLLREIFSWRYSPIFVLVLFLTIDTNMFNCAYSIYRLQVTLPMEFGLYAQFLCAMYLIRYLRTAKSIKYKKESTKFYWDENLFLFMMSLSVSIAIHYYTTIMAFILCSSFAVFHIRKIFCSKYFVPLIVSVLCGCVLAGMPVIGALATGASFEGSINWGLKAIQDSNDQGEQGVKEGNEISEEARNLLLPTTEDLEVVGELPESGQKIFMVLIKMENLIKETVKRGYRGMYGKEWGNLFFGITLVVSGLCLIGKRCFKGNIKIICSGYPPIILASFVSIIIYMAYAIPELGLPVIIAGNRYSAIVHIMVLAVMIMLCDFIFSVVGLWSKDGFLQVLSYGFVACIYICTNVYGIYHGYLYYSLTRYDAAVMVTNEIIEKYPKGNFTIVSPNEELCQVDLYGKHEEISGFIKKCEGEYYSIPTEYVFLYVEKRPIVYYQSYYFNGPRWLATSKNSEIMATEISKEAAQNDISGYENASWAIYMNGRTILESKVYEWCQRFSVRYPETLQVFYEDTDFVCYYFKQDTNKLYNLAGVEDEVNFVCNQYNGNRRWREGNFGIVQTDRFNKI